MLAVQSKKGLHVGIADLADKVTRQVDDMGARVSEALFEPVIRLGVTGLARAGKTVFITSLVANLLERARMGQVSAIAEGRVVAAFLQPQPDDTVPRFEFENHLAALAGPSPRWPDSTRAISELRLSLRLRPTGWLAGMTGLRTVHVDIIDYPGEWVLDLGLLAQDFSQWSAQVLARVQNRPQAGAYLRQLATITPDSPHDEAVAQTLAAAFAGYLQQARDAGFYDCTPGRFLLPGELQGSPVLTFAPLPPMAKAPRKSLWVEMERRFEAYKAQVVRPFFRQHFAKIDRQVVLVDALGAINSGPAALEDLRQAMAQTLSAFRPGRNGVLTPLLGGKRVEKILFAATKADHLHHTQHPQLSAIMHALTKEARLRADFAGAETAALALAAWRATTEDSLQHNGQTLPCVRGRLQSTGKMAALYPGALPDDPGQLLAPARQGAATWLDHDYQVMAFAPPVLALQPGEGPPHIRLDRAAQFLIGDKL